MANTELPSDVEGKKGFFDRFADKVSAATAKSWFFALCVLLVLLWLPSFFLVGTVDTWQLIINTLTTIVTFLLVGLMQNTTARSDAASQKKMNAVAEALWEVLKALDVEECQGGKELQAAIGLENKESA